MDRLTNAQRVEILKLFYVNNSSTRQTFRALRGIYGRHNRPTESAIQRLIQKFETTGSVCNNIPKKDRKFDVVMKMLLLFNKVSVTTQNNL